MPLKKINVILKLSKSTPNNTKIALLALRTNILHILFCCISCLLFSANSFGQEIDSVRSVTIPSTKDRIVPQLGPSKIIMDPVPMDTVKIDSLKIKEPLLTDKVVYSAKDYMRLSRKEGKMYLYNKASIIYGDISLEAGLIILNNEKNEVYAYGITDTLGNYIQTPIFKQAQRVVKPDSIRFNFDTKKALVYGAKTQEGEFKVQAAVTKRQNDSVSFMRDVRFTTAENVETAEYYFFARKIKFVPGEKIVTGLVNMYLADVPTPIGLPFGYFPLTSKRTSGFIIPSYGDSRNRGFSLQNGGYYFAINDYLDLTVLGDYYTNGSYGLRFASNYALRYKFSGNVGFRYEKILTSEPGFPDYSESSIYNIRWSHRQASKANPTSRFAASVNLGSSKYYRRSANQSTASNFLNNTLSSSVSYSKTFPGEPQINFSLTATHSQNTNTREINMTLPTLQASMSRIYPFKPKTGVKKGIIENINFQYSLQAQNRFNTTDSLFFKPEMFESAVFGAQHSIPINTNFKLFNYLSVSAGTSYRETWVFKTFEKSYNPQLQEVVVDTVHGFEAYRTYNFHSSIGTTIYGLFTFGKDSKIKAIRHVMRPSISYNINPAFDQYYDQYIVPGFAGMEDKLVSYSKFQGTLYGAPGNRFSSSIGFSLSNNFEAKVRAKDSTGAEIEPKKITLLSNLNLSTSYNLAKDSLNLSPININGSIPIIQDKLDINIRAQLDIYALNNNNQRIDKLNINNGGSLFRLTRANASFGYSFSSKNFDDKDDEEEEPGNNINGGRRDDLFGKASNLAGTLYDDEEEDEKPVEKDTEFFRYSLPWDLRVAYTMTYNNSGRVDEITSHSIMFSGDVELSPRWSVGVSSGYDLKNQGFTYTQLRFQRDLKSWTMSFNWTPFGIRESWFFFIGIKASVLRDIKYDKRREPDRRL